MAVRKIEKLNEALDLFSLRSLCYFGRLWYVLISSTFAPVKLQVKSFRLSPAHDGLPAKAFRNMLDPKTCLPRVQRDSGEDQRNEVGTSKDTKQNGRSSVSNKQHSST